MLYGSETWTLNARDTRRVTAAEMKYVKMAGYTWTTKQPHKLQKELKITPILDKIQEYKRNWTQHVNRMPRNRLPRVLKHYSSTGIKESWQTFEETKTREAGTGQQVAQIHDR